MSLNGSWRFAFDKQKLGKKEKWCRALPAAQVIRVPLAYQSKLSGIGSAEHCDVVWYGRELAVPPEMTARRLLHFGAVDYQADVWLDGQYLGGHTGGYAPFVFDVTDPTAPGGTHTISVRCEDRLDTYFGMRKIEIVGNQILLNWGAIYQRLILDQGYWPDGLLTLPSGEALKRGVELVLGRNDERNQASG